MLSFSFSILVCRLDKCDGSYPLNDSFPVWHFLVDYEAGNCMNELIPSSAQLSLILYLISFALYSQFLGVK